jgi:ankyrin repeat protein
MDDYIAVREYLRLGGPPDRRGGGRKGLFVTYSGVPIIVSAARHNCAAVVQCLIDAGADVNLESRREVDDRRDGELNALGAATTNAGIETIRCLLRAGINCNLKDSDGRTPLGSLVSLGANRPQTGLLGGAVCNQLQTLKSGDLRYDRLINACGYFAGERMCTYDLRQLVRYEQDAKTVLSLVQGAMEDSLLPEEKENFYREVLDNGRRVGELLSMFKPIPDYGTQTLQLLLAHENVDLMNVDNKGNTVLHLAAKRIIRNTRDEDYNFARAVKWLQILRDNERVKREVSLDATNAAGESVQKCITDALQCIADRVVTRAEEAEVLRAEAERARIRRAEGARARARRAEAEETVQRAEAERARARRAGRLKKIRILLWSSTIATTIATLLLAWRYSKTYLVCNKQAPGFPAFATPKTPEKRCSLLHGAIAKLLWAWNACSNLASRWWRGALKDQMW